MFTVTYKKVFTSWLVVHAPPPVLIGSYEPSEAPYEFELPAAAEVRLPAAAAWRHRNAYPSASSPGGRL